MQNLLEEIFSKGLEEKLRKERQFFIRDVKGKVMELAESSADVQTFIKELTDYLTRLDISLTINARY